jgi:predicted nucleic acid-binding protein
MILVDTSVIADVLTRDEGWFDRSSKQIERWANEGPVCYDTIVFAELAVKFDTQKELEHRLSAFTYLPLPINAAFQAGKAFEKYRRAGGKKARPLPDFFIGARAYVAHLPLLTRDPRRVRSFFPSVRLITP